MDLQRFTTELPGLFDKWGTQDVHPKSTFLNDVLAHIQGMTTSNVLQVLNHAVACLGQDESYLEIGCFRGATLIGALVGHPHCTAYAADNFSEFDPHYENAKALHANLARFRMDSQVRFFPQDFEELLLKLRDWPPRIGVYFYDGAHDYRSQLVALMLAVPLLATHALIIVDDSNNAAVKQATWDFLAIRQEARLLYDLGTPRNCHPGFWNGLHIVAWEANSKNHLDHKGFFRQRQTALLKSIYLLQNLNLAPEGNAIRIVPVIAGSA